MEFKSLKNIETGFRQIRLFTLVFLALCAAVTLCAVWMSYRYAEAQREKIYVLDQGKSLMLALSQDLRQNRPVEAREHVRRFHELFFTYGPEKSAIEGNVNRALLMADRSAMNYYKVLMEKGYFNRLIAGGILQTTQVDSVVCDMNAYPYRARAYATQKIVRESTVTERSLVTTCTLIDAVRSDANPQGFLIGNLTVVENKDLRTYDRQRMDESAACASGSCHRKVRLPARRAFAPETYGRSRSDDTRIGRTLPVHALGRNGAGGRDSFYGHGNRNGKITFENIE